MKKKTNGSFKKGHKVPIIWRKKISDKNKGKHYSIDTEFKKGSKINLGRKHCLKQNNKHSEHMKTLFKEGKIKSYSKGKTYEELFGENAELEKRKKVETRMRNGSYKRSEEFKAKAKIWTTERIRNGEFPKKNTSIELKIQDFLTLLKIEFLTHKYMNIKNSYQCDILIPEQKGINQKTIIECDGDFFHCNPNKFLPNDKCFKNGITAKERWKLDKLRTQELQEKGYRVIRLWEHEIKVMELNDLKNKII